MRQKVAADLGVVFDDLAFGEANLGIHDLIEIRNGNISMSHANCRSLLCHGMTSAVISPHSIASRQQMKNSNMSMRKWLLIDRVVDVTIRFEHDLGAVILFVEEHFITAGRIFQA